MGRACSFHAEKNSLSFEKMSDSSNLSPKRRSGPGPIRLLFQSQLLDVFPIEARRNYSRYEITIDNEMRIGRRTSQGSRIRFHNGKENILMSLRTKHLNFMNIIVLEFIFIFLI